LVFIWLCSLWGWHLRGSDDHFTKNKQSFYCLLAHRTGHYQGNKHHSMYVDILEWNKTLYVRFSFLSVCVCLRHARTHTFSFSLMQTHTHFFYYTYKYTHSFSLPHTHTFTHFTSVLVEFITAEWRHCVQFVDEDLLLKPAWNSRVCLQWPYDWCWVGKKVEVPKLSASTFNVYFRTVLGSTGIYFHFIYININWLEHCMSCVIKHNPFSTLMSTKMKIIIIPDMNGSQNRRKRKEKNVMIAFFFFFTNRLQNVKLTCQGGNHRETINRI